MRGQAVLGISFDGLAVSGVVNELLNIATVFERDKYRILVDLGEDITHRDDPIDPSLVPGWARGIRSAAPVPETYSQQMVEKASNLVVEGIPVTRVEDFGDVIQALARRITETLERESVRIVIVENGTLPDNPLFTEALYVAIGEYGGRHGFGKYVVWRDHDLMWSTEPHRYGPYPYPGVRRPRAHRHIHYCVATEWMRRRFEAWARVPCHILSNRFYVPGDQASRGASVTPLRDAYGIPKNAFLIARSTRVIPPKGIEHDLRLMQALQQKLDAADESGRVYLFITGPINEDPEEYGRLVKLTEHLGISSQIIWGNGLLPYNPAFAQATANPERFSVADLLAESDLSSFLTTYDYEGFGNPPGEAMAMGVPYIATTYELYDDVYGSKGAIAPLLSITRETPIDAPIPDYFVNDVLRLLTDAEYRQSVIARNNALCRRFFSLESLDEQLRELFADALA